MGIVFQKNCELLKIELVKTNKGNELCKLNLEVI